MANDQRQARNLGIIDAFDYLPEYDACSPSLTGTHGRPHPRRERILFVDDENDLVELGKEILETFGYSVTTSTGGPEALERFRAQPNAFDLVITDMTMPTLTGLELAREILSIRPDLPVILCTGYSDLLSEKKGKDAGIREILVKPYAIMNLAERIRGVLDRNGAG